MQEIDSTDSCMHLGETDMHALWQSRREQKLCTNNANTHVLVHSDNIHVTVRVGI